MKKLNYWLSLSMVIFLGIACSKEDENKKDNTDEILYNLSKTTIDFTWFKNSSDALNKSTGSAHAYPFLKTRYNSTAATQLDENGKIKADAQFPEGSLIVKELINENSQILRYAILYKNSKNANADSRGWVWGYIDADGTVADPASNRGKSCINCHLQTENIDYMLMNKFFP